MDFRRFRNRFRMRLAAFAESITNLRAALKPKSQEFATQRMCPFCGLITPRSGRVCLECGKSLRGIQVERKDAKQS